MKNVAPFKKYNDVTSAYLAGIIDGEGSIYIGAYSRNKTTGVPHYQTNIEVTNTSEALIDWLVENIGGRKFSYTAAQMAKNCRKQVFRWTAQGESVLHICYYIKPYLIIKKKQCEIMIDMRLTFAHTGIAKNRFGSRGVPAEIQEQRHKYWQEIKALHCRNYNKI